MDLTFLVFSGDEVDCVPISYILLCSAVIGWNSTAVIGASFRSVSFCSLLLHGCLTVVFFSIIDIQATRILIPLSLVMLLGLSLTWIASYVNLEILVLTFPALALYFWLIFCYGKKQLLYFSMIRGMLLTLIRSGNVSCTNHFTALEYLAQITGIGYCFLVMMSQNLGAMHTEWH